MKPWISNRRLALPQTQVEHACTHAPTHARAHSHAHTWTHLHTCARNCPHENVHCVCTSAGFPASSSSRKDGNLAVAFTKLETVTLKCKVGEFFKSTCLHTRSIHSYLQAHTGVDARTLERRTMYTRGRRPATSPVDKEATHAVAKKCHQVTRPSQIEMLSAQRHVHTVWPCTSEVSTRQHTLGQINVGTFMTVGIRNRTKTNGPP